MDLHDYLRVLSERWRIVVGLTILPVLAAVFLTLWSTPVYEAQAQLFVSAAGGEDATSLLQGSTFTQQRVKSYADIVTSPQVLDPVIEKLQLDTTAAGLATRVTAQVPLDTVLINVTARDTDPARSARIAKEVASTFADVVVRLERPTGRGPALVKVSVVRSPAVPTDPVSPRPFLTIGLGLVFGLLAGFGLALIRDRLDKGIKDEHDLAAVSDVPVIGAIAVDDDVLSHPLVVRTAPQGPTAETFRQIRTNLRFIEVANSSRSIVFTSAISGEGKSTVAANLAITLTEAGSRTVLVDADLRKPQVAHFMGLEGAVGLTSVLIGSAELDDVLQPWGTAGLDVLTCGPIPPNPSELLGSPAMIGLLRELESRYEHVIIDSPPLLPVTDAAVLSQLAGGAVVIVGAGRVNRDQVRKGMDALGAVGARVLGIVVNRIPGKSPDEYSYYGHSVEGRGMPVDEPRRARRSRRRTEVRA